MAGHRAGKGPFSGPPHNPAHEKLQAMRASIEPPLAQKAYNVLIMGTEEASAGGWLSRQRTLSGGSRREVGGGHVDTAADRLAVRELEMSFGNARNHHGRP